MEQVAGAVVAVATVVGGFIKLVSDNRQIKAGLNGALDAKFDAVKEEVREVKADLRDLKADFRSHAEKHRN